MTIADTETPRPGPAFEVLEIGRLLAERERTPFALDLGAGNLRNAIALSSIGYRVLAIDSEAPSSQHPGIEFVRSRVQDLDFESCHAFNLVIASGILQFLSEVDANSLLHRVHAKLAPGGVIIVTLAASVEFPSFGFNLPANAELTNGWVRLVESYEALSQLEPIAHESYLKTDCHPGAGQHTLRVEKYVLGKKPVSIVRLDEVCVEERGRHAVWLEANWPPHSLYAKYSGPPLDFRCADAMKICRCGSSTCAHPLSWAMTAWVFAGGKCLHLEGDEVAAYSERCQPPLAFALSH